METVTNEFRNLHEGCAPEEREKRDFYFCGIKASKRMRQEVERILKSPQKHVNLKER